MRSSPGDIQSRLDALSREFQARYGDDLSDLSLQLDGGAPRVSAVVVVDKQRRRLLEVTDGTPTDVVVLARLDDDDPRLPLRAEHPGEGPVPLYDRRPEERGQARLTNEWLVTDGDARVLHRAGAGDDGSHRPVLLQLRDGTVAWCAADVRICGGSGQAGAFVSALSPGARVDVDAQKLHALCRQAEQIAESAAPYKLGGRTPEGGIDCSALVQHLVHAQAGAWLPRHTTDQMRVGIRVPRPDLDAADLLFARTQRRNIMHVGVMTAGDAIVHACRLERRVMRESVADFLRRYRFLRGRRWFRVD